MVLGHAHETRDILETRGFRSEQTRGVAHFRSERQQQAITCSIMAPQREIKEKEKRTLIFFVKHCKPLDARKSSIRKIIYNEPGTFFEWSPWMMIKLSKENKIIVFKPKLDY